MEKIISVILLIIGSQNLAFSQNKIYSFSWQQELRKALTLDIPLRSDSTFTYTNYDYEFQFFINKKRPEIERAILIIDTLLMSPTSDTTIGRLTTILQELDVRYLAEFAYYIDYFRNVYHWYNNDIGNDLNELDVIKKLEQSIILLKIRNLDTEVFADILLGRMPKYISKEYAISSTWKQYGHTDVSFLRNYYNENKDSYEKAILQLLETKLTSSEAATISHLLGIWKTSPPQKLDCNFFHSIINKNTAPTFIKYIDKFNNTWYQQECIQNLINTYREN